MRRAVVYLSSFADIEPYNKPLMPGIKQIVLFPKPWETDTLMIRVDEISSVSNNRSDFGELIQKPTTVL